MASSSVPLLNDDTVPFGEEGDLDGNVGYKNLPHPYVTFFHLFFRGTAIVTYIFCGLFSDSFISSFVLLILLLSADFWIVKNITGRLLVGLRWWNYVDDNGQSHWVFESGKHGRINGYESRLFWLALILAPILWVFFFVTALFGLKFKWLVPVLIALALNGANLYGYIKCHYGSDKQLNTAANDFLRKRIFQSAFSMMTRPTQPDNSRGQPRQPDII